MTWDELAAVIELAFIAHPTAAQWAVIDAREGRVWKPDKVHAANLVAHTDHSVTDGKGKIAVGTLTHENGKWVAHHGDGSVTKHVSKPVALKAMAAHHNAQSAPPRPAAAPSAPKPAPAPTAAPSAAAPSPASAGAAKASAKISAAGLVVHKDGTVAHKQTGVQVGTLTHEDGKYVAHHGDGTTTKHATKQAALSAMVTRHNKAGTAPAKTAPAASAVPAKAVPAVKAKPAAKAAPPAKSAVKPAAKVAPPVVAAVKAPAGVSSTEDQLKAAKASGVAEDKVPGGAASGVQSDTHIITYKNGAKFVSKDFSNDPLPPPVIELGVNKEVMTSKISDMIGAGAVPIVKTGPATLSEPVIDGHPLVSEKNPDMTKIVRSPRGRKIGLLDILTGQSDRHNGNIMINKAGEPVPIDHNDAWGLVNEKGTLTTNSPFGAALERDIAAGKSPFSVADLDKLEAQIKAAKAELTQDPLAGDSLYNLTMDRMALLKKQVQQGATLEAVGGGKS